MSTRKIYRLSINNKCTKCGICSSMLPEYFIEDTDGSVRIKNDTINESDMKCFERVQGICLANAIHITEIKQKSKEEYEKEIRMMLNRDLGEFTLKTVEKLDYQLDLSEIVVAINFPSEISDYKYSCDETAEEKGREALSKIYNENKASILRGALIDHKIKKLDKFLDKKIPFIILNHLKRN